MGKKRPEDVWSQGFKTKLAKYVRTNLPAAYGVYNPMLALNALDYLEKQPDSIDEVQQVIDEVCGLGRTSYGKYTE